MNESKIKKILTYLRFKEENNIFSKNYNDNHILTVVFNYGERDEQFSPTKSKINYEDIRITVERDTTSNLEKLENLVVLECVDALLSLGYSPDKITLEPNWQLGHERKGGYADIMVKDNEDKSYLMVECKTFGSEYKKEWENMKTGKGQLFSYLQQDKNTRFICLYSFDVENFKREYKYISIEDKLEFKNCNTTEDYFFHWKNTYNFDLKNFGIFEDNCSIYEIGKTKLTAYDLKEIDSNFKTKYNEYAEILRKNNISSKERAFDTLLNLFLCKIVDEENNKQDLKFYWKGSIYDKYEDLIDRLQQLYQVGMKKFLNEDVTYIAEDDIENAFRLFKNKKDETKNTIKEYFKRLKYYTNNDFAFIDVHNEKLFNQNSKILLETVKMLENIKIKTYKTNQFLGDLFEGFLSQGVKQDEGQFFTPTPIVKFIVSSLPLKNLLNKSKEPLKILDFACGAGHFLNEYATQIKQFIDDQEKIKEYYKNIYGIEKEYRLSKVAKVSAYMFKQDEINIIYNDGLSYTDDNIKENSIDLIIANPPYSVKGFLSTMDEKHKKQYELWSDKVKATEQSNNSIECFFIERAKQLLKDEGICAIILPTSVISKDGIYNETQKLILENFEIIAIVETGSQTFSTTGTTTNTLFLRKRKTNPNLTEHYKNRVGQWFSNDFSMDEIFKDNDKLKKYCQQIKVEYETFIENIEKKNFKEIDKQKLLYFLLANDNRKVLVVKAPQNTKENQDFLGYKWVKRKGSEGIQYLNTQQPQTTTEEDNDFQSDKQGINKIKTILFDPNNFDNQEKINYLIRQIFLGQPITINQNNSKYCSCLSLVDMLDFTQTDGEFKAKINVNVENRVELESKYNCVALGEICNCYQPKTISSNQILKNGKYKVYGANGVIGYYNEYNHENSEIAVCCRGATCGSVNFTTPKSYITGNAMVCQIIDNKINKHYLHKILQHTNMTPIITGSAQPQITKENIIKLPIPLPPLAIQNKIVEEIKAVEDKKQENLEKIEKLKGEIKEVFKKSYETANNIISLGDKENFDLIIGYRILQDNFVENGIIPVYSANCYDPSGYVNNSKLKDFDTASVIWGIDGNWQVNYIDANIPFAPTDHTGVLRLKSNSNINLKYIRYALEIEGIKQNFSRTNRASIDRIKTLNIKILDKQQQDKIISQIDKFEKQIEELIKENENNKDKSKDILDKYLK